MASVMRLAKVSDAEARAYIERQDAAAGAIEQPDEFEVYPENWDTVMLFLRVQTQWVVAGMGELVGLNYVAVESVMRMCKVKDPAGELDRIRFMEAAVLETVESAADGGQ